MEHAHDGLVPALNIALGIDLPEQEGPAAVREALAAQINEWIQHDFEKLVFLLYRIDVDEARMRALLKDRGGADAPWLIADLIMERQLAKIRSRQETPERKGGDNEEHW
ncbi:MAG: hypothetical protein RJA57_1504 [Bacteroidota bacterium]|jgi:hypothetical protein